TSGLRKMTPTAIAIANEMTLPTSDNMLPVNTSGFVVSRCQPNANLSATHPPINPAKYDGANNTNVSATPRSAAPINIADKSQKTGGSFKHNQRIPYRHAATMGDATNITPRYARTYSHHVVTKAPTHRNTHPISA